MEDFILAQEPKFTIRDYKEAIDRKNDNDKTKIACAIKRRLVQRYIEPGKSGKINGFNIMANCCLLIESYESFYRGWKMTPNGSEAFCKFFNRSRVFMEFTGNDTPHQFYIHIRCGILHRGETSGGWRIRRDLKKKLDLENKIIDAGEFRDGLETEIDGYFDSLKCKDWETYEWKMLQRKMKATIENCKND